MLCSESLDDAISSFLEFGFFLAGFSNLIGFGFGPIFFFLAILSMLCSKSCLYGEVVKIVAFDFLPLLLAEGLCILGGGDISQGVINPLLGPALQLSVYGKPTDEHWMEELGRQADSRLLVVAMDSSVDGGKPSGFIEAETRKFSVEIDCKSKFIITKRENKFN